MVVFARLINFVVFEKGMNVESFVVKAGRLWSKYSILRPVNNRDRLIDELAGGDADESPSGTVMKRS